MHLGTWSFQTVKSAWIPGNGKERASKGEAGADGAVEAEGHHHCNDPNREP